MLVKIKPLEILHEISSYDLQMEKYVETKENRIIEVDPINIDGRTYYKCQELDYFYFSDFMFAEIITVTEVLKVKSMIEDMLKNSIERNDGYEDKLKKLLILLK